MKQDRLFEPVRKCNKPESAPNKTAKRKQGGFLMPESGGNMTALILAENGLKVPTLYWVLGFCVPVLRCFLARTNSKNVVSRVIIAVMS